MNNITLFMHLSMIVIFYTGMHFAYPPSYSLVVFTNFQYYLLNKHYVQHISQLNQTGFLGVVIFVPASDIHDVTDKCIFTCPTLSIVYTK